MCFQSPFGGMGVGQRSRERSDETNVGGYFGEPARAQTRTAQQQLAVDVYKELVEINTVTATGDTARAAEAMAARLRAAGFSESNVQVFTPAPRKGNLVARLRGTGARWPMLLLAHLDVVG